MVAPWVREVQYWENFPRQPVPTARGVPRASRGAGRAAVADAGRVTPAPYRRPKSHGSGAPFRAPLGFHWRRRRTWSKRRQASFGAHERWISTVSPPGGMRSKPTNTARGTPVATGKSCGEFRLCALPTTAHRAAGFFGPGVPRALALAGTPAAQLGRGKRAARTMPADISGRANAGCAGSALRL